MSAWVNRLSKTFKKLIRFSKRQIKIIHDGEAVVLLRKCLTLLLFPAAFFVVSIVRLLSPIVVVRFGSLLSRRIGHFAGNTEIFLCKRDLGVLGNKKTIDIFYYIYPVSNEQLRKMWARVLLISDFANLLHKINCFLPGGKNHMIPWEKCSDRDTECVLVNTKPHLAFSRKEESKGVTALRDIGILNGSPFACFYARDPAYLDAVLPQWDWDYHSYRDCSIHNFIFAAEELTKRGYFAIRMGAIVKEPLQTNNPKIIDYAVKYRSDFLDIYLSAKCRFFVGCPAGLIAVPLIFRQPVVYVNSVPFEYIPIAGSHALFIPKKLWLRKEKRFMGFGEILDSGVGMLGDINDYKKLGIELIENTPEEIAAVTIEMDERLKGTWQAADGDAELQERFRSLFKPNALHGKIVSRIGAEFLRQNQQLLD